MQALCKTRSYAGQLVAQGREQWTCQLFNMVVEPVLDCVLKKDCSPPHLCTAAIYAVCLWCVPYAGKSTLL